MVVVESKNEWPQFDLDKPLPASLILESTDTQLIESYARYITAQQLCPVASPSCGTCRDCLMFKDDEHPDVFIMRPEKQGGHIKVDQVRELQSLITQRPVSSHSRVVMISPLESFLLAAANAFLKTLEEPPSSTVFILLLSDRAKVLPTILSRCQIWHLQDKRFSAPENFHLPDNSIDGDEFLKSYSALLKGGLDVAMFYKQFAKANFKDLLQNIQLISYLCLKYHRTPQDAPVVLLSVIKQLDEYQLLQQLDKINKILQQLQDGTPVNSSLSIEYILSSVSTIIKT